VLEGKRRIGVYDEATIEPRGILDPRIISGIDIKKAGGQVSTYNKFSPDMVGRTIVQVIYYNIIKSNIILDYINVDSCSK
jgi:hypothetical protein